MQRDPAASGCRQGLIVHVRSLTVCIGKRDAERNGINVPQMFLTESEIAGIKREQMNWRSTMFSDFIEILSHSRDQLLRDAAGVVCLFVSLIGFLHMAGT